MSERVLVVFAEKGAATHPLPAGGTLRLGRDEGSDIHIDDASISRDHALLHVGTELTVEDRGSKNGTVVRGIRHVSTGTARTVDLRATRGGRLTVQPGDVLLLGSVVVTVQPAGSQVRGKLRAAPPHAPGVVVEDPAMRALYDLAARIAVGDICVLLRGETGAGKDVLAEAIHRASPRAKKPLVRLNCAAFTETLLESELFGHEKGAFTGAARAKPGLLETAQGGSVFLDEVGEMPLPTQAKLLRVLEAREVLPVGALKPRPIDVRFIAATNRDLEAEMARGAFRSDLYFRLNGISLMVPPLRERVGEIVPLAKAMIAEAARKLGRRAPALTRAAEQALERHPWPGNLRELRNVIDRAVLLAGDKLDVDAVRFDSAPRSAAAPAAPGAGAAAAAPAPGSLPAEMQALERQRIIDALERCGGNQTEAARTLGMARRTLINRLDEYKIPRPRKPSAG